MGEIARSKSRIASDLKSRDSNRWRPCDLKLRSETRDWRFVLNTPIQKNCEKGCDLSPRSKIASDWRLAIGDFAHLRKYPQYCWEFHDQLWEALSGTTSEKRGAPSRTGGGDSSGNALEASNALNYRAWGIPPVLSTPSKFQPFSSRFVLHGLHVFERLRGCEPARGRRGCCDFVRFELCAAKFST